MLHPNREGKAAEQQLGSWVLVPVPAFPCLDCTYSLPCLCLQIEPGRLLGQGGFGTVAECKYFDIKTRTTAVSPIQSQARRPAPLKHPCGPQRRIACTHTLWPANHKQQQS